MNSQNLSSFGTDFLQRVEKAITAVKVGKPVLLLDSESRENESDFVVAAEKITNESMNFMIREGSGIVCLCLTEKRVKELDLPMMVTSNDNHFGTGFTVSIEAKTGVTTGVSVQDRVRTVQVAIDDDSTPHDLARPGHMFPLRALDGGVLKRPGHTEGSIDLVRLAGLKPAAVICELMNQDGTMARPKDAVQFALRYELPVLTITDVIQYRLERT